MRTWKFPFTAALMAFNMAVEAAMCEDQPPAPTPIIMKPVSTSFAFVTSTIVMQDTLPKPANSVESGIGPPPSISATFLARAQAVTLEFNQTNSTSLIASASLFPWDVDPATLPDAPITGLFLALFLVGAALHTWRSHMVNNLNMSGHRPTLSAVVLAFCALRVVACALRIGWATQRGNEVLQISEMIISNIGSVTIFMASAILAQRIIGRFSLTSLSGSSVRIVVFWLSNLLLVIASLSSVGIIVVYSVGTSQLANMLMSNGTSGDDPMVGLTLLRIGVAWLSALGAWYILLVAVVVVTAGILPRQDRLSRKLTVFFVGVILLEIGQGFRLGGLYLSKAAMGRPVFYVTGFTLEVLVVMLYAKADLDQLFSDGRIGSSPLVRYTTKRRTAPFGFFRNDEHGIPRGAQNLTAERTSRGGGITISKSLDISVVRLGELAPSRTRDARSPSVASDYSDVSAISGRASRISEIDFPLVGSSRPRPAHTVATRRAPRHGEERAPIARSGSVKRLLPGTANPVSGLAGPSSSSLPPPRDPFAKPRRPGLRQLEQQLESYENDMELSEDQKILH